MAADFAPGGDGTPWTSDRTGADCSVHRGAGGADALEVVVTDSDGRPSREFLRETYADRRAERRDGADRSERDAPILVVASGDGSVGLCGPSGEAPTLVRDVDPDGARRVCAAALAEPSGARAREFLVETLPRLAEGLPGLHVEGVFSPHVVRVVVPERDDWDDAARRGRAALSDDPRALLRGLDYEVRRLDERENAPVHEQIHVLRHATTGREAALAVFLDGESLEHERDRLDGTSAVESARREADRRDLDAVVACSGETLRLYPTDSETGTRSSGWPDTYVELDTRLLADDRAAYLWLLLSADALQPDGTLHQILEASREHATGVSERLRERIYDDVVPRLAAALTEARGLRDPTKADLDETYRTTLVLLYRLLFVAYAEDERLLPRHRNATYDEQSLGEIVRQVREGTAFGDEPTLWNEVTALTRAIHDGEPSMGLPAYDGWLLSDDEEVTDAGARLSQVELPDAAFGPALEALFVDETPDGRTGPVDFRDVGVREFGAIYEGLLESELSVADRDLTTERADGEERYVPADGEEVVVPAGQVYLHGQSGERKASGTYYTKPRFVEHLLEYALEPALDDHLDRIDRLREEDGDAAAVNAFFDFRTADVAMGSGHFLVGAVDRIERAFRDSLRKDSLAGVERELDTLEAAAKAAFEGVAYTPDVGRRRLLRRQVARRCLYGVDSNGLATELARLSLWVHTFVPGLPLTSFDHTLRTGDSLAGIGTVDEAAEMLTAEQSSPSGSAGERPVVSEIRATVAELGAVADESAERCRDARRTRREVDARLAPIGARFDILAASRVDEDIDPEMASTTDVEDPRTLPSHAQATAALASTDPLHFPVAFPEVFTDDGGFDVVVGNPPWEEAVLEADEFWGRYLPGLQGRPQGEQERLKAQMRERRPDLVEVYEAERAVQERRRRILANGPYPGMGTGDPDTYKAFYWRCWHLLRDGGALGVVLPRSSLVAAGSEPFRRTILTDGAVTDVTLLQNDGGWVFDAVAEQYTVALLAVEKTDPGPDGTLPLRGPYPSAESYERGLEAGPHRFPLERARNWTGTASFPTLPDDPRSVAVFDQQARHPPLGLDDPDEWRARPNTELHATNDKRADDGTPVMRFTDDPPADHWPVFKGGSFTHWVPDTGDRYAWVDPDVAVPYLQAQRENSYRYAGTRSAFAELPESWVHDPETLPCLSPRVAFRDIARSSDPRTIVTALVPPETVLTNKAPYFLWPRGDERDEAYLLGVTSSIPFDWYARRFVELGVNYHLLNAIPVPRPGDESPLRERVVSLAGRLAAVDDRYDDWADAVGVACGPLDEATRREAVHELDALVAHLYGLSRAQLEVVFETFGEEGAMAERSAAVLEWFDEIGEER